MKKYERKIVRHDFNDFVSDLNLWNIITGGSGQSLNYLRNIVDAAMYNRPPFMPRILLVGGENTGLCQHAKATVNSFCMSEIRETCCRYLDNDYSKVFFESDVSVAHVIYDADEVRHGMESILWRYLGLCWCGYSNPFQNNCDVEIINCKGLVVLTATDLKKVSKKIVGVVDYVVELEEYTQRQLEQIVLQRLKYCNVDYENEAILNNIVMNGEGKFENMMRFLRICLDVAYADMRHNLMAKDVEIASKIK